MLIELPLRYGGTVWINPTRVAAIYGPAEGENCHVDLGGDLAFEISKKRVEAAALINAACAKREVPGE